MFYDVHDMCEASCYSSENENKLVEICFMKNYTYFSIKRRGA